MMLKFRSIAVVVILIAAVACKKDPEIKPISNQNSRNNLENSSKPSSIDSSLSEKLHTVVVKEILPASRYTYLKVQEGGEEFWIAVRKQEVKIGETYYYNRALLKTDFESKENNKLFDKIYLVSSLVSANHGNELNSAEMYKNSLPKKAEANPKERSVTTKQIDVKGSIKIAEIVKDPKKYESKTVQISGECVKINPNIMDRNWIHLKDGSKDDYDLVITSNTFVPEGSVITMNGTVTLNKDFGAGYKYDIILENGEVLK